MKSTKRSKRTRSLVTGSRPTSKVKRAGTVLATGLLSLLFVIGVSVPAQAATSTYANQQTLRNQTVSSGTAAMNGGSVASSAGTAFIQTKATVINVGTFNGLGNSTMNYTHARSTTYVYCGWRADNPDVFTPPAGTKYTMTCKYTY